MRKRANWPRYTWTTKLPSLKSPAVVLLDVKHWGSVLLPRKCLEAPWQMGLVSSTPRMRRVGRFCVKTAACVKLTIIMDKGHPSIEEWPSSRTVTSCGTLSRTRGIVPFCLDRHALPAVKLYVKQPPAAFTTLPDFVWHVLKQTKESFQEKYSNVSINSTVIESVEHYIVIIVILIWIYIL